MTVLCQNQNAFPGATVIVYIASHGHGCSSAARRPARSTRITSGEKGVLPWKRPQQFLAVETGPPPHGQCSRAAVHP